MLGKSVIVLGLVALLVMGLVLADCPHSCSNHGDCHHDECRCDEGWSGDDCSQSDTELESGEVYEDSLNTFSWHYYHISVGRGTTSLNVTVHQTSTYGDVDVYIQRNSFPTLFDFLQVDDSTSKDIFMQVLDPAPGTYYIGLYGYWHVDYTLMVESITGCAEDCGAHGRCQGTECVCFAPYVGESCNIYDRALSDGERSQDAVDSGEWKYYHFEVTDEDTDIEIEMEESGRGDVDVYLRKGSYPSFFEFDFLNGTIDPLSTLYLEGASSGIYYIGLYGYRGDSYTLSVELTSGAGCIALCSGITHGTCRSRHCECTSDFTGHYCETMVPPMELNKDYQGHVDTNTWNYYKISVRSTNDLVIMVDQEVNAEDCDVFVNANDVPTRINYEYAELSYKEHFNVTIEDPSGSDWYVGVYGWTSCSYHIGITIPVECVCKGAHGSCAEGSDVCVCDPGWTGPYCDESSRMIDNGEVLEHESVNKYEWAYYSITTDSSMMLISMKEEQSRGFLFLYASMSGFPSLDAYDKVDKETNTDFHEVHFEFDTKEQRSYFIGVYGSPFDIAPDAVPFTLTAWSPPI